MITHTRETITPEKAKKYLSRNCVNRPLRQSVVNKYARDIENGLYTETHQGIAFDEDGNLIDGQHRLFAIIKAQKPIVSDVARNVQRSAGINIDTGKVRDFNDIAHFDGRWEDDPAMRNKATTATVRQIVVMEIPAIKAMSSFETFQVMEALAPQLRELYSVATCRTGYAPAAVKAAALAAMLSGEDKEDIKGFFGVFCNGAPSGNANRNDVIAFNWRDQVLRARVQHRPMTKDMLYNGTQNAIWNYCRNTRARTVKTTAERRYPVRNQLIKIIQEI